MPPRVNGEESVNREVVDLRFKHLTKTLEDNKDDLEKLKTAFANFELKTTRAISVIETKLMVYVAVGSIVSSVLMQIVLKTALTAVTN